MILSASQISVFSPTTKGCPRRWYFRYKLGVKEPVRVGPDPREAGSRLHAISEAYLSCGTAPDLNEDLGLRFAQGLRFLPPPGSGGVEQEFNATIGGVSYVLYLDCLTRTELLPALLEDRLLGLPAIIDHKSTKNPKKKYHGKKTGLDTPDDFLRDPQALLYAAAVLALTKAPAVYLRWIYYATEGAPYAEARDCLLTRSEVESAFAQHVHRWAVPLIRLRRSKLDPLDVPAVPGSCWAYKSTSKDPEKRAAAPGCYLQDRCTDISDNDRHLAALRDEDEIMSDELDLLEQLRRTDKAGGGKDLVNGKVRGKATTKTAPEPEEETEDETPPPTKTSGKAKSKPADEPEPEAVPRAKAKSVAVTETRARADNSTRRDIFAVGALEVAARHLGGSWAPSQLAEMAAEIADALIAELDK